MKLKQIGWLVWRITTPDYQTFEKLALTDADRKAGFRSQPIYIDEDETS